MLTGDNQSACVIWIDEYNQNDNKMLLPCIKCVMRQQKQWTLYTSMQLTINSLSNCLERSHSLAYRLSIFIFCFIMCIDYLRCEIWYIGITDKEMQNIVFNVVYYAKCCLRILLFIINVVHPRIRITKMKIKGGNRFFFVIILIFRLNFFFVFNRSALKMKWKNKNNHKFIKIPTVVSGWLAGVLMHFILW